MVEGYSRELSSCGFWPGGGDEGAFYAYAYPQPDGYAITGSVLPRLTTEVILVSTSCHMRLSAGSGP